MEKNASQIMNEAVAFGFTVSSRGEAAKMIGGVVGAAMSGQKKGVSTPANQKGPMFIALGESHLAFFSIKRGFFKNSVKDLLAKHPHSDIQSIELHKGTIPKLDVILTDGTCYGFEMGKIYFKQAKKLKETLGK